MEKEKQIEEMAKDMCEYYYEGTCYQDKKPCDCKCDIFTDAQYLYAKGYRKASEVAKEVCAEIGKRFESLLGMLPAEGALTDVKTFIDAHWEFIEHSIVFAYDAELKKKYTEEGK
jgi:hypothetical protein